MPDYLLTKDWKTVLNLKEHSKVKKTGVSEILEDYASARKKDDLGQMVSALKRIRVKAKEVKEAQKAYPKIVTHLDKMIEAAKTAETDLGPRLARMSEQATEDGSSGDLAKALKTVKLVARERAWNFVLVPGKPSSGLVLTKTSVKKDHMTKAFEMRGKKGPFFLGTCYGENSKYVFELPDTPPKGLATSIRKAALLHAEMAIKLLVRGGGVELDSDTDIDGAEESLGTGPIHSDETGDNSQVLETRIGQLELLVGRMENDPNSRREGALDGLIAGVNRVLIQVEEDTTIDGLTQTQFKNRLNDLLRRANAAGDTPKPSALSNYPSLDDWRNLAQQIDKLDPSKHEEAWKRYMARYRKVAEDAGKDQAIVGPDRTKMDDILDRALQLAEIGLNRASRLQTAGLENDDLSQRFIQLERNYDKVMSAGLPGDVTDNVVNAFMSLRMDFRNRKFNEVTRFIGRTEELVDNALTLALRKIRQETSRQDQAEMHRTLAPSMELIKKAAFSPGMIRDPASMRDAMKQDPNLLKLVQAGASFGKRVDEQSIAELEKAARDLLAGVDNRKPGPPRKLTSEDPEFDQLNPNPQFAPALPKDTPPFPGDEESEKMAREVLKRASMARMAIQYQSLGAPPWDEGKTELASELQAQLFFLESAIAKGEPNFRAPSSKDADDGGASGAWWIERTEVNRGQGDDPKSKKTYIFKPGSREAPVFAGLPQGSGAPREVLAKKLDDFLSGAGFDIGVSPTTLANLDSSQLGGDMDPKAGPQLGSMQRLAPSDGSIDDIVLASMGGGTAVPIQKSSYDSVAVFDMIFGNLDRHGGNILVQKDPETGTGKLVPIDHGSALPDPDALQLNRAALLPPENAMADPRKFPGCAEPLSDEAIESLARLNPDDMVREMKQQRDDMARRHPGAQGMISDAAIDSMAARVRFIKQIGNSVPVAQLFDLLAFGAKRIADCAPDDIPALAQTLLAESNRRMDGAQITDKVMGMYRGLNTSNIAADLDNDLKLLGWGWAIAQDGILAWARKNPDLVGRILKTRMENPAAVREVQRLLPLARVIDNRVDAEVAKMNLGARLKYLIGLVNKNMFEAPNPNDTPLTALMQEYQTRGGDAGFAEVLRVLPATQLENGKPDETASDDRKFEYYAPVVKSLRLWEEFQRQGGTAEIVRLGGEVPRNVGVEMVLQELMALKIEHADVENIMEMSDQDVDQEMVNAYQLYEQETDRFVQRLANPDSRQTIAQARTDGMNTWQNNEREAGLARIMKAYRDAVFLETEQIDWLRRNSATLQKRRTDLSLLDFQIQNAFEFHRSRLDPVLQTSLDEIRKVQFSRYVREWDARLEEVTLGDQAKIRKRLAVLAGLEQRVNGHAGTPWHDAVKEGTDKMRGTLDLFDFTADQGEGNAILRLDCADKLAATLGNTPIGNLSNDMQQKVARWIDAILRFDRLNVFDDFIKELSDELNVNAV